MIISMKWCGTFMMLTLSTGKIEHFAYTVGILLKIILWKVIPGILVTILHNKSKSVWQDQYFDRFEVKSCMSVFQTEEIINQSAL